MRNFYADSFLQINPNENFNSEWYVNYKDKKIFITINKCAGSSLRKLLNENKYILLNKLSTNKKMYDNISIEMFHNFLDNKFMLYSIIRNPLDRYRSGLNEFISMVEYNLHTLNDLDYESNLKLFENQISKNKFIFDEHTLPQFLSLQKYYNYNVQLLKLNNISKKISCILNKNVILPHHNTYHNKPKKNYNYCKKIIEKYCRKNPKFYELYKKDYELYNISL